MGKLVFFICSAVIVAFAALISLVPQTESKPAKSEAIAYKQTQEVDNLSVTPEPDTIPPALSEAEVNCGLKRNHEGINFVPSIGSAEKDPEVVLQCLKSIASEYYFHMSFEFATILNERGKSCRAMHWLNQGVLHVDLNSEYRHVFKKEGAVAAYIVRNIWYSPATCMPRARLYRLVDRYTDQCAPDMSKYPRVAHTYNQMKSLPKNHDRVYWNNCRF